MFADSFENYIISAGHNTVDIIWKYDIYIIMWLIVSKLYCYIIPL